MATLSKLPLFGTGQFSGFGPGRLLSTLLAWNDRSRQRFNLRDMDDRMLSDIGVTRDEAVRETMKPFWQD